MDISNIVNEHIAIHCPTEEDAKRFIKMSYNRGYIWAGYFNESKSIDDAETNYKCYGERTCYVISEGRLYYDRYDTYKSKGYKIVLFSDLKLDNDCYNMMKEIYDDLSGISELLAAMSICPLKNNMSLTNGLAFISKAIRQCKKKMFMAISNKKRGE